MARSRSTATRRPRKKSKNATMPKCKRSTPPLAFSVAEFCEGHGISRDLFYELLKAGLGPDCMMVGKRRLITPQASERWQREREAASAATEVAA